MEYLSTSKYIYGPWHIHKVHSEQIQDMRHTIKFSYSKATESFHTTKAEDGAICLEQTQQHFNSLCFLS